MNVSAVLLAVTCAIGSRPAPPRARALEARVWWSASLRLRSLADVGKALAAPMPDDFPVRVGEKETTVRTCRDFLGIAGKPFDTEDDTDWNAIWYQGMRCFALDWLSRARPAARSFFAGFDWSKVRLTDLPPELGLPISPEERRTVKQASAACKSLRDLDAGARVVRRKGDDIVVRGRDWAGTLTLLGRGDFDGDGIDDLMIERTGGLRRGTAAAASLFLLSKRSERGCLRVIRRMH